MRKLAIGLLAATGIALAVPANAEGVWIGAGPVGVGVGIGPYAHDDGYVYAPGPVYRDYGYGDDCRVTTVYRRGQVTHVRRCDW
jgi:hypothetical protein